MNTTLLSTGAASALEVLKILADETRWALINELRVSDRQVGELVERLKLPQSLVSYHLGLLRQAGLVQARRSETDARILYYSLSLPALDRVYRQIGAGLHLPAIGMSALSSLLVVFVCTANSARSQMAEGWLRHLSGGQLRVRSAGTEPARLNPLSVLVMAEVGVDIGYHYAKSLDALSDERADLAVTVCDRARESCPIEPIAPVQLHWSIPDPARPLPPSEQLEAFRAARDELRSRVDGLLAVLPVLSRQATV
ncbi:MAG TPA: metalloregulator ArsR/SmtB family transcription factor [Roseiflexaceae bacterium]|nr:metalloregulator ArsR/SmtB family transcription factor [Roseiflexaceae bacterium]